METGFEPDEVITEAAFQESGNAVLDKDAIYHGCDLSIASARILKHALRSI